MFKTLIIGGTAALAALGATAAYAQTGGATGSYGATAIAAGHLNEAERTLRPVSQADAADPARLINIATVYARTQRAAEAKAALLRVQTLPAEELDLANGSSRSSHMIANAMLASLEYR